MSCRRMATLSACQERYRARCTIARFDDWRDRPSSALAPGWTV